MPEPIAVEATPRLGPPPSSLMDAQASMPVPSCSPVDLASPSTEPASAPAKAVPAPGDGPAWGRGRRNLLTAGKANRKVGPERIHSLFQRLAFVLPIRCEAWKIDKFNQNSTVAAGGQSNRIFESRHGFPFRRSQTKPWAVQISGRCSLAYRVKLDHEEKRGRSRSSLPSAFA